MKSSDALFQLIHSMSPAEKRIFAMDSNRYKDDHKKYLQLYEAYLNLKEFDEAKVRKIMGLENHRVRFSNLKNHLWEKLQVFLYHHEQGYSVQRECNMMLDRAKLLRKRTLYKACKSELRKAKKKAREYDLIDEQLNAILIERTLVKRLEKKRLEVKMNDLMNEWKTLTAARKVEEDQILIYDQLSVYMRAEIDGRDPQVHEAVSNLLNHPALSPNHPPQHFHALRWYHLSRAFCFDLLKMTQDEYQEYQELAQLWEDFPKQVKAFPNRYLFSLCNLLYAIHKNQAYEDFPQALAKIKVVKTLSQDEKLEKFSVYYFYKLIYSLNLADFQQAQEDIASIKPWLKKNRLNINDSMRLGIEFNIALTFFFLEEWKECRRWLIKLIDEAKSDHRQDLQALARVLHIVVLFDLGEINYWPNRVKTYQQWLRNRKLFYEFEKTVLRTFRTMGDHLESEWKGDIQELLSSLQDLRAKGIPYNGMDEMIYWCKARINQRPLLEVFRNTNPSNPVSSQLTDALADSNDV